VFSGFIEFVLFDECGGVNEILTYKKVLVALALGHLQYELLSFNFHVVGDVEVEFAGGDCHGDAAVALGKVGLDGMAVLIEFVVS
jgi:hypothetical protein